MEFTIDELTALVFQHTRRAMQARKTANELMALADEDDKLALIYLEVGKRLKRSDDERESKMNLRKIITSVVMLVLFSFLMMGSLTLAQDAPLVTNTPLVAATAEVTPEPVVVPVETGSRDLSVVVDALKELALIAALIVLAFKTSSLIPATTVDKVLARGFDLAKGLADGTPTPIDNRLLEIAQPIISKLIADELAKRDANYTLTKSPIQLGEPISGQSGTTTMLTSSPYIGHVANPPIPYTFTFKG